MVIDTCPTCSKQLEPKQINMTHAILICTDLKCPYPVNESQCIVITRGIDDINKKLDLSAISQRNNDKDNMTPLMDELEAFLNSQAASLEFTSNNTTYENNTTNELSSELDDFLVDLLQ